MVGEVRLSMQLALAIWLISTLIGGGIVALPDDGQRLVSLSAPTQTTDPARDR